jgi:hypothetical protein
MATRIYRVNYTTEKMVQICEPEYFMSLTNAKAALVEHGYHEVSPEDFDDNTCAQWEHDANFFFEKSFAYIGFFEAKD